MSKDGGLEQSFSECEDVRKALEGSFTKASDYQLTYEGREFIRVAIELADPVMHKKLYGFVTSALAEDVEEDNITRLLFAAAFNQIEVVKTFSLFMGNSIWPPSREQGYHDDDTGCNLLGMQAARYAVEFGHIELTRLLLSEGYGLNDENIALSPGDKHGKNLLHIAIASENSPLSIVNLLLEEGGADANSSCSERVMLRKTWVSALELANESDCVGVKSALINAGADTDDIDTPYDLEDDTDEEVAFNPEEKRNSLMCDALNCNGVIFVQHLIAAKANPNGAYYGLCHLARSINSGSDLRATMLLLAAKADPSGADVDPAPLEVASTPLCKAIHEHNVAAVRLLLAAKVDPNNTIGPEGAALHVAASDPYKCSPTQYQIVHTLLAAKADSTLKCASRGRPPSTPLEIARTFKNRNKFVIEALLGGGQEEEGALLAQLPQSTV